MGESGLRAGRSRGLNQAIIRINGAPSACLRTLWRRAGKRWLTASNISYLPKT